MDTLSELDALNERDRVKRLVASLCKLQRKTAELQEELLPLMPINSTVICNEGIVSHRDTAREYLLQKKSKQSLPRPLVIRSFVKVKKIG